MLPDQFKRTKIGGKCQKINSRMRHLGWFSLKKSHFAEIFKYCAMSQCSRRCINTTSGIFSRKNAWNAYHWDAGVHTVRFVVGYDRSKHQCQRNRRRYQSKVHHLRKWHNGNITIEMSQKGGESKSTEISLGGQKSCQSYEFSAWWIAWHLRGFWLWKCSARCF